MIEKYYEDAISQVVEGAGKLESNNMLVRYSNDFSIEEIVNSTRYKENNDVFFAWHEFQYNEIAEGYEPYLSIIKSMFRTFGTGDFSDFMRECDVYELHCPIFESYFATGTCERIEPVLLAEVKYEQERMADAIVRMLLKLSEHKPLVILLNRFQMAAGSTMRLTHKLLCQESKNISILLGVNDVQSIPEFLSPIWDDIVEQLESKNKSYHIGKAEKKQSAETKRAKAGWTLGMDEVEEYYRKVHNLAELLDYEHAFYLLDKATRRIKFENIVIAEDEHYRLLYEFARVSIFMGDLSKALENCENIEPLLGEHSERWFEYYFLLSNVYMYLGKLKEAMRCADKARKYAEGTEAPYLQFQVELLKAQVQMSGWCNIFFCAQDIEISDSLLEQLHTYHYRNHLAYVYIYAYDNKPEIVAQAYRSEARLIYFSKGISIAKEIGNEQLINTAYTKNTMIASTNGIYDVSLLYSIRKYEVLKNINTLEGGRIFSSIAYNLCAMGQNERAQKYYAKALQILYTQRLPEDIAEVQYNMALDCIMRGEYQKAEIFMSQCMRAIEKLRLNSLRVCNLSKLYGLLALVSILQKNRFNCERYLNKCSQFLNYILEKENAENDLAIVHDYAKSDDDMFLYRFSLALLNEYDGDDEAALKNYEVADGHLKRAEGNQFFCYELFRKCRIACFSKLGREFLCERENAILEQYVSAHNSMYQRSLSELFEQLPQIEDTVVEIATRQIDELIKYESIERSNKRQKRQLEFISTWQKQVDMIAVSAYEMIDASMKTFLNHFNVDKALYIRYIEREPQILYNDTGCQLTVDELDIIEQSMKKHVSGFVISKIGNNYSEHQDITAIFGTENVCSMVAIPYYNNAHIESVFITYVLMKDNWHSSLNRYMLDEEDLNFYKLLFREVRYSLNRLDAYEKIYEMNNKLYLSAVTDPLTGIYNRDGFYRKLTATLDEMKSGKREACLGIMFVDLDNFKHYNDTFGHDIGDLILIKMANIFTKLCEEQGFVCRYGGDEFLMVFYQDDKTFLEEIAKRVYEEIDGAQGFEYEIAKKLDKSIFIEKKQWISCSIGVATAKDIQSEADMNRLIKQADELLYSIKTSTKGTYKI